MTMTIEFHCPKCGKHIKAPKEAAGKNGKCPACHQSVYVPTPDDEIEPLWRARAVLVEHAPTGGREQRG